MTASMHTIWHTKSGFKHLLHARQMGGSNVFAAKCKNVRNPLSLSGTHPIATTRLDLKRARFGGLGTLVLVAAHLGTREHTRAKVVQVRF
jgi:hypothetical protein